MNTRNVICYSQYGQGHPQDHYVGHKQGAEQLMVWVGLMRSGTAFGPYVVRGNLTTREYLQTVRYNVIQRDFRAQNINMQSTWWQQDGEPSHTGKGSINYLHRQFPGKVISKRGDWNWPPCSPDLAVLDFFLWGYLKHKIWSVAQKQQPTDIMDLKAAIVRECAQIPRAFIRNVFDAMMPSLHQCWRKCI